MVMGVYSVVMECIVMVMGVYSDGMYMFVCCFLP